MEAYVLPHLRRLERQNRYGVHFVLQVEAQLLGRHQRRRGLEGIVQPGPQVAIDEQLLAQQGHQIGQAPAKRAFQLQVHQQQHRDQRRPDLNLHRVLARADESLDLQSLFQGLEKQFYFPALLVNSRDGPGRQTHIIGDEQQRHLFFLDPRFDPPQLRLASKLLLAGQRDHVVAHDLGALRHRQAFHDSVFGVILEPGDEIDLCARQRQPAVEVGIAALKDDQRTGREGDLARLLDLGLLALGDDGVTGQTAVMVENQVQFQSALGRLVARPIEALGAQLDHARVKAQQLVLEAELAPRVQRCLGLAAGKGVLENGPVQRPGPVRVGCSACALLDSKYAIIKQPAGAQGSAREPAAGTGSSGVR